MFLIVLKDSWMVRFDFQLSSLIKHGFHKVYLSTQIETGSITSENPYINLKRIHGMLNILGWGILIIVGAIIARHFREWDPFWFNLHASVQSLGFALGVIGVISGLVLDYQLNLDVSTHEALGIAILMLGCLQVFLCPFF